MKNVLVLVALIASFRYGQCHLMETGINEYTQTVREDVTIPLTISPATLKLTKQIDANLDITYFIKHNPDATRFTIDKTTGVFQMVKAANYDTGDKYFTVTVCKRYDYKNESSHLFNANQISWEAAEVFCITKNGHLATIDDSTEESVLKNLRLARSIDSVWIGLNDRRLENTFEWVSGDVSAYRNWATGKPKVPGSAGEDEDCVALHDQMVDESCAHLKESICEITPGITGECTVLKLPITNVVDIKPTITSASNNADTIYVYEDTDLQSVLYVLKATGETTPTFKFSRSSPRISFLKDLFKLDSNTGKLKLNDIFDYEIPRTKQYKLYFKAVTSPLESDEFTLTVNFVDVNDNAPVLTSKLSTTVDENVGLSFTVHTLSATDADSTSNGGITYSITDTTSTFQVDSSTGIIKPRKQLNYETQDSYTLTTCASDLGTPSMSTCERLVITVNNLDEFKPVFSKQSYTVSISEKVTPEIEFFRFLATDQDKTAVTYSFALKTSTLVKRKFSLDSTTGAVALRNSYIINVLDRYVFQVDYDNLEKRYDLHVEATDKGGSKGSASLNVVIVNENDNSPIFAKAKYEFAKDETTVKILVGRVTATDKDGASITSYSIVTGTGSGTFSIDAQGDIRTTKGLNYEDTKFYQLTVCANDQTTDSAQATPSAEKRVGCTLVEVTVNNIWDTTPKFTGALTQTITIPEKTIANQLLYQLSGSNQGEEYEFYIDITRTVANTRNKFSLSSTGALTTTKQAIDYEAAGGGSYSIFCKIRNSKSTLLIGTDIFRLNVNIVDVNDQSPIFAKPLYAFTIAENSPQSSLLGSVKANDNDQSSSFNTIRYRILNPASHSEFSIVTANGNLYADGRKLDREAKGFHQLTVCASDQGEDPRQNVPKSDARESCAEVQVTVKDLNDNKPIFAQTRFTITVSERAPKDMGLFIFEAQDVDIGNNGYIEYEVTNNLPSDFAFDKDAGLLMSRGTFDFERTSRYIISVRAANRATTPRIYSEVATLTVQIADVNDNSPVFSSSLYKFNTPLLSATNRIVGVVKVTDDDISTVFSTIRYSITSASGTVAFAINTKGEIYVRSAIGTAGRYTLSVTAQDMDLTRQTKEVRKGYTLVEINVIDYTPYFEKKMYYLNVLEGSPVGTPVGRPIIPSKAPFNDNRILTYSILTKNVPFAINAKTGSITLTGAVNREMKDTYLFDIFVDDTGQTPNTAPFRAKQTSTVSVTINDRNEPPRFGVARYAINVPENAYIGSPVYSFIAIDDDLNVNGQIRYTFLKTQSFFNLDTVTGVLSVRRALDYETTTKHEFQVRARDGGTPSLYVDVTLTVTVTDVNDNAPRFINNLYTVSKSETLSTNVAITNVGATDRDRNDLLTYSLIGVETNRNFAINSRTGYITSRTAIDYERTPIVHLLVKVTDRVGHFDVAEVKINVIDDSSPAFNGPFTFTGPYTFGPGRTMVIVYARHKLAVTYQFTTHNDVFQIDKNTGEVSLMRYLKSNEIRTYNLRVVATNSAGRKEYATVTLNFRKYTDYTENRVNVILKESTNRTLALDFDLNKFFGDLSNDVDSVDVYAQYYEPGDKSFTDVTLSPPLSYNAVNVKCATKKDMMRRWLAYKYFIRGGPGTVVRHKRSADSLPDVDNEEHPHYRGRRAIQVTGNRLRVKFGDQAISCCLDPNDPKMPCNGPLDPNRQYRFQIVGHTGSGVVVSSFSNSTKTRPFVPPVIRHTCYDYIIGLCICAVLLFVSVCIFSTILCAGHWERKPEKSEIVKTKYITTTVRRHEHEPGHSSRTAVHTHGDTEMQVRTTTVREITETTEPSVVINANVSAEGNGETRNYIL